MDEAAWDRIAPDFDEWVLDVAANDRQGLIRSWLERLGGKDRTAADIGCGVGRGLDTVAEFFGRVYATDISRNCLSIAANDLARFNHIRYIHADLSITHGLPEKVDVAVCMNTLLIASLQKREAMFHHLCHGVKPGGHVVLVVPALESALYISHRMVRNNRYSGMPPKVALSKARREMSALEHGIVMIDGVPTKHHLKDELHDLLELEHMRVLMTEKIEYPWSFVLELPPEGMGGRCPWNWMVVAQRVE